MLSLLALPAEYFFLFAGLAAHSLGFKLLAGAEKKTKRH
jgi:hypothetical protein